MNGTSSPPGRLTVATSISRPPGRRLGPLASACGGGPPRRITLGTGPERHPEPLTRWTPPGVLDLQRQPRPDAAGSVDSEGSPLRGLSADSPAWAPDGRSLVFISARIGGRYDLWVQPVIGSRASGPPRRLTDHPGSVASPAVLARWPLGGLLPRPGGQRDIWMVPVAGGNPVQFTDDPAADIHPAWSPDGAQLAFASERAARADLGGARRSRRPAGPPRPRHVRATADQAPAWSPDGTWIAYIGHVRHGPRRLGRGRAGARPRMLATEGSAGRVAWDRSSKSLFVSGQWDPGSFGDTAERGEAFPLTPRYASARIRSSSTSTFPGTAALSSSASDELRGDIWALEATDRPY